MTGKLWLSAVADTGNDEPGGSGGGRAHAEAVLDDALDLLHITDNIERGKAAIAVTALVENFGASQIENREAPTIADTKREAEAVIRQIEQASKARSRIAAKLADRFGATYSFGDKAETQRRGEDRQKQDALHEKAAEAASGDEALKGMLHKRLEGWQIAGGRTNTYSMKHGTPKDQLAARCYILFSDHRPGEAKSTVAGDFHKFVGLVYELATGREFEKTDEKLLRYVRRVVRHYKNTAQ